LINKHKKESGLNEIVDFVPCPLHVVHNAFRKGLEAYGDNAEELAIDLFQWFKSHTCQREDFTAVQQDLGFDEELFIRHVQCRWLTLLPALERVEKHWEAAKKYFLKDLPRESKINKTDKLLANNSRYIRICEKLVSIDSP